MQSPAPGRRTARLGRYLSPDRGVAAVHETANPGMYSRGRCLAVQAAWGVRTGSRTRSSCGRAGPDVRPDGRSDHNEEHDPRHDRRPLDPTVEGRLCPRNHRDLDHHGSDVDHRDILTGFHEEEAPSMPPSLPRTGEQGMEESDPYHPGGPPSHHQGRRRHDLRDGPSHPEGDVPAVTERRVLGHAAVGTVEKIRATA